MMAYLYIAGGLLGLILGAEVLLRGAVGLSKRLGVSPLVIGLTVVAFATSLPELIVCLTAAFADAPDIVVGNIIGSNIANILLILGVSGLIAPVIADRQAVRFDTVILLTATLLLVVLGVYGQIDRLVGFTMAFSLAGYLFWTYRRSKAQNSISEQTQEIDELDHVPQNLGIALALLVVGLLIVIGGSHILIDGAVTVSRRYGVPESVIGLTLVALGTSLPELAAAIVAAHRGHPEMAFGNVIGSNIFNILGITGLTAAVVPVPVSEALGFIDGPVMLGFTLLLIPFLMFGLKLGRRAGLVFLVLYGCYVFLRFAEGDQVLNNIAML